MTIEKLRRLVSECRADREKVMVPPDVLEALLDLAESAVGEEDVLAAVQRAPKAARRGCAEPSVAASACPGA